VAVVQISRIQLRRGRENQGSGLPQLASGELGWAIDTQNLYIGNGAVAEGAPEVGNTKILTEKDNIFAFANQYTYLTDDSRIQTGSTATSPVQRSLQARLDDIVFVKNFGANGDGTIQTAELQRAIDNLYLNTNKNLSDFRFELQFGPGVYVIDATIKLPPFVNIKGAGPDKTIIRQTVNAPIFETVNGSSSIGTYDVTTALTTSNQPRGICVTDMTLEFDSARASAFHLVSIINSEFRNLKILGNWPETEGTLDWTESAFNIERFSDAVPTESNRFENISINGFTTAFYSDHDIQKNVIVNNKITNCGYGVVFGRTTTGNTTGQRTGPTDNIIENNVFDVVHKNGVWIKKGSENFTRKNKFYFVGTDGGNEETVVTSIINFEQFGNNSEDDYFQRTETMSYGSNVVTVTNVNSVNYQSDTIKYIPEIEGKFNYKSNTMHEIGINYTNGNYVTAFRLPGNQTQTFTIDYRYVPQAMAAVREGTLEVIIDRTNDLICVNEEFDLLSNDQSLFDNLMFRGKLINIGGQVNPLDQNEDTVYIEYNSTTLGDSGKLHFTISSKS
jgi:hypothetical protein